jgi:mannose-6-phosphate isomerase-like protein (cupin superfamily)
MKHCVAVFGLTLMLMSSASGQAPQPQTPQPQTPPPQTPPPRPQTSQPSRSVTSSSTLSVEVTNKSGNPVADVQVSSGGPVDRSGSTGQDGAIVFRSMRAGTYRLRFEREGFTTLEREVTIRAGQPLSVSVALTAAPVTPAPAPMPEPVAPPPVAKPSTRVVEPRSLSIPDFLDKNLIGGEPQKTTLLACAEGGTARLVQIREPLSDHQHADVDELMYVVAGAGVIRMRNQDTKMTPGFFVFVPRGIAHALRRDGRNPLIVVSAFAGTACNETAPATR